MAVAKPQTAFLATTSGSAAYTVDSGLGSGGVGNIKEYLLCNVSTGTATVTVYAVPSSGSPTNSNMIINAFSMSSNQTERLPFNTMLEPNAFVWVVASNANCIKFLTSALEFTAPTILKSQTPGLLQLAANTYYTVTASSVGNPKEILLCNTSTTTPYTATIYFVGPAGSTSDTTTIAKTISLAAGQTDALPFNTYLAAGGTIQALASSADKISIRVSATEYM